MFRLQGPDQNESQVIFLSVMQSLSSFRSRIMDLFKFFRTDIIWYGLHIHFKGLTVHFLSFNMMTSFRRVKDFIISFFYMDFLHCMISTWLIVKTIVELLLLFRNHTYHRGLFSIITGYLVFRVIFEPSSIYSDITFCCLFWKCSLILRQSNHLRIHQNS